MGGRPDVFVIEMRIGAGGAWVDVSADVEAARGTVGYTFGRSDRFGEVRPSSLSFELANNDKNEPGRYTPDNPLSPYYGRLVEGVAVRWTAGALDGPTPATTRYRHWYGEVAVLNPIFPEDDHAFARVQVRADDILARLGRAPLRDLLTEQTLVDGAGALWLLNDPQGSIAAAEHSPADVGPLTVAGEARQIGWAEGGGVPYDGMPSLRTNGNTDLSPGSLFIDQPPPGLAVLECWISYDPALRPGALDPRPVLFEGEVSGGSCEQFAVAMQDDGKLYVLPDNNIGSSGSAVIADGRLHHVAIFGNHPFLGGSRVYVDGVQLGGCNAVWYGLTSLRVGDTVLTDWRVANGGSYTSWKGTVGRVALDSANTLNVTRIPARYGIGTVMQETAPDRVQRLLSFLRGVTVGAYDDLGSVLAAGSVSYSGAVVGPQETQSGSLLAALIEAWAGEGGQIRTTTTQYSGVGYTPTSAPRITFSGRAALRPLVPQLTLDVAADLDGSPDQTRGTDGQVAVVTSSSRVLSVTVQDDALAAAIGPVSGSVASALVSVSELTGLAQDRIARTRAVRTRITSLATDPLTGSVTGGWSLWGALLNLRAGDRIRVTGLPASKLGFSIRDCYVIGGTERHTVNGSSFQLLVEAADEPAEFWMEDAVYGRVSSDGDLRLNAALTAGATSMAVKWTTYGLSTDAADYPLDLDVNGERVTVTAAPAGGSSPQTVTVVRGVGDTTARAHLVDELVDVWLTPSVAL